jgi:polysaccharide export outer membrane protein
MFASRTPAVLSLVMLLGCTTAHLPPVPTRPMDDPRFAATSVHDRSGLADDRPERLMLLPGDTVDVQIVSTTTTNLGGIVVDGLGLIHVPLAGDVAVAGLGLSEAEAKLTESLQRFDKLVQVNLVMRTRAGHNATVLGAITTPGVVPLNPAMRLSDVLLSRGGPREQVIGGFTVLAADLSGSTLIRNGTVLPVDFEKALAGVEGHNVYVHSGDHIYLPPVSGRNISVMGPGSGTVFQWTPGLRMTEALARAGGVSQQGDKDDVRIVRGTLDNPRVYTMSMRDIIDGDRADVELYPGDVIYVTDHWIEDMSEVFAAISPVISLGFSVSALAVALSN